MTGQATGLYLRVNGRGRSPERNYDDGAGEDYRIGTLSEINNIIYCKNDCLQSTTYLYLYLYLMMMSVQLAL